MNTVVEGLNRALDGGQMEKVSMLMDRFETQVENLNVQTAYMETSMSTTAALTTPEDQVTDLMQQVADEHGLELGSQLGPTPLSSVEASAVKGAEADPLSERLARLRNS